MGAGLHEVVLPVPRRRLVVVVGLLIVAVSAGIVAAVVATGAALFVVESPSMGRAAPVGTLVVTTRTPAEHLSVGDIVTYRPPEGAVTTTHRVVEIVPGGLRTRGDLNGADDAWTVRPSMLVGRAVVVLPAAGWVVRAAPWCTIGLVSVWLLTWPIRSGQVRAGLRVVGASAVVTSFMMLMRPLTGWLVLMQQPVRNGIVATVVSTGVLPVRLTPTGGEAVTLQPGMVDRLLLQADSSGRVGFQAALGLQPVGWAILGLVCLLPLIAVLLMGLPSADDTPTRSA